MTHPELVDCVKSMYLSNDVSRVLVISVCVYGFVLVSVCAVHIMCFSSGKEERLMPITKRIIINQIKSIS